MNTMKLELIATDEYGCNYVAETYGSLDEVRWKIEELESALDWVTSPSMKYDIQSAVIQLEQLVFDHEEPNDN